MEMEIEGVDQQLEKSEALINRAGIALQATNLGEGIANLNLPEVDLAHVHTFDSQSKEAEFEDYQ